MRHIYKKTAPGSAESGLCKIPTKENLLFYFIKD